MPHTEPQPTAISRHRLLLVEDDASVGPIVNEILCKSGYDVVLKEDLIDTMLLDDFSFSVVIADYKLRYSNGCDVIDFVRGRTPEIGALLISGFGQRVADCCADRGISNVHFLAKPFSPSELLQTVATVLAANRAK